MKYATLRNHSNHTDAKLRVQLLAMDELSTNVLEKMTPILEHREVDAPDWVVYLSQYKYRSHRRSLPGR